MSWERINLANLEPRPAITPSIGGVSLIYPGKRHVFSGPPESAKTLAAHAIAIEEVRLDGNVLLVDFEMGQWDARDRLREMGATDAELEHVFYVEPETPASEEIVENLASQWALTLVVVDAAAGAYGLQGLDDNARRDVELFARIYVRAFWLRGVATIVIDHVAKNRDTRGSFAIGSERKVGGADVHLGFETVLPIKRGGRGLYKVICHKDRLGHIDRPRAADLELRSTADKHAISWTFRAPQPATETTEWRPTHLMEKVSRWLENQRDTVTRNEVERNVTGKGEFVRAAMDALITDGYVLETAGTRRSRLVSSLKPYRESSASDRVPSASGHSHADVETTASRVPLSKEGTHSDAVDEDDERTRLEAKGWNLEGLL